MKNRKNRHISTSAVKISNFLKSKMADGRYFKKFKIAISPQWFDGSHQNLAA